MARGKPFKQSIDRLVKAGVVPKPLWLDVVEATRPPFNPVSQTKSKAIVYPEDRLRSIYLRNNPDARRIPVNLKAKTPAERHVSDRFVAKQMKLMEDQKLSERDAYKEAEEAFQVRDDVVQKLPTDDMASPLSDPSVEDEAGRLYLASVRDSERDQKLFEAIQEPTETT